MRMRVESGKLKAESRGSRLSDSSAGFTIIELTIATTVFATVLILCTIAMLQIGRTYYKGITTSRTQEVARSVIDRVTREIQYGGGTPSILTMNNNSEGYCVGRYRFSYALDYMVVEGTPDTGQNESNYALVVDETACSGVDAQDLTALMASPSGRELLGTRMRLAKFNVVQLSPDDDSLWRVTVRVVSGDNDLLTPDHMQCSAEGSGGQFCAVSELSTIVQKRVR